MTRSSTRACLEVSIDVDLLEPNLDIALLRAVEKFRDRALGMEDDDGYVSLGNWRLRLDSVVAFFSSKFDAEVTYTYTFKPERR